MKKISIIVPCYNAESYIDRCIRSMADQTIGIDCLEIICVDRASEDGTWLRLLYWEQLFPENILLIHQEINQGKGTAGNIGLQYASSDWISFVDAEDWLEQDYFEQLLQPTGRYDCDAVTCGWMKDYADTLVYFDADIRTERAGQYLNADTEEAVEFGIIQKALGNVVFGKVIRREILTDYQLFFSEDLQCNEEYWIASLCRHISRVYNTGKRLYHHFIPGESSDSPICDYGLRIVLFYSDTESFNFFNDQLALELRKRGNEVFICDLNDTLNETEHSYDLLNRFLSEKTDMVICFDGLGTREEQFIREWDRQQAVVVDILMDPPFRFHPTLERHPQNYMLFCCDLEHVEYVKKYFKKEVASVAFMPHVGVLPSKDSQVIPYEERKYDILFSGTYHTPQSQLEKTKELFPKNPEIWDFYQKMYENLVKESNLTIEEAVLYTLMQLDYSVTDNMLKMLLNRSLYADWAIRMYHRGRVISMLAEAGFDLYLLGQGWEEHSCVRYPNVHWIENQIPYEKTLSYMADTKISLNVMPWFKAGTHDRIFNTLLQQSVPLTDPSIWILNNFADGKDIALYDLEHLELLPGIADRLLKDVSFAQNIIQNGYRKVSQDFTWSNCADYILQTFKGIRKN